MREVVVKLVAKPKIHVKTKLTSQEIVQERKKRHNSQFYNSQCHS